MVAVTLLATVDYPSNFPCLNREGYQMEIDLGIIRTASGVVLPSQRRAYNNMPIVISAEFIMSISTLFDWSQWVNNNVGKWVNFPLAHPFMNSGIKVEYAPARIINGSISKSIATFDTVTAALALQLSPSIFAETSLP